MTAKVDKQTKHFFNDLSAALWSAGEDEGSNGSYAGGGDIDPRQQHDSVLEAVHVEGVGDLRLPLSSDDALELLKHRVCKRAPYGHGMDTRLDPTVRCAWQVDASKVTFPSSPEFLSKTVPLIVKKALRSLAIDGDVEAHLYKLLLYEAGGRFVVHRDTEKEPGMFATLIIQLPTQEGFEGGKLVVYQGETFKTFDFSIDSATKFFYSIFYADCEHQLLEVTKGKRLCLSFNLVQGIRDGLNMPLDKLIEWGYSSRLSRVEAALEPWLQARLAEEPLKEGDAFFKTEKLVIPLKHKYSEANLCFSGLKGDDRILAQILQNCRDASGSRSLDLHLCLLTLYKDGIEGNWEYLKYNAWIGMNDKPCNFEMRVSQFEVVTDKDVMKSLFNIEEEDRVPDDELFGAYTGNEGPTMEYLYHNAMLVIWPKENWLRMACIAGLPCALDILETKAEQGDAAVATYLHEVLKYCEMQKNWKEIEMERVISRLVDLSLEVGGMESAVRVLKLLSKPFINNFFNHWEHDGKPVGINGPDTALAVASVVQKYGWINCGPCIMELVTTDKVRREANNFVHLALELTRLGCEDAGLLVAKRTLEMIFVASASDVTYAMVYDMVRILRSFKGCFEDVVAEYAKQFQQMRADVLCSFIVNLYENIPDEIRAPEFTEGNTTSAFLFKMACDIIITKDFHQPALHYGVLELVKTFILLGNEQLLDKLIQALVDQSREHKEQNLLIKLLNSEEICNLMAKTAFGRSKLQMLIEERIQVISGPAPPFTWCMPRAELPNYPEVEAFLRGPLEKLEYSGKFDSSGRSELVCKGFNSNYQKGYSAKAIDTKRSGEDIVAIIKTRAHYEFKLSMKAREQQEELPKLRYQLEKVLTTGTSSNDGATMEEAENGSESEF